jgi:cell division septum initiation protein DivIVA
MTDRQKIQKEMEEKLAEGQAALDKLKARLKDAGHEASGDLEKAVAEADQTLEKGRAKLKELAAASDEEFEGMWTDARETWHSVSHDIGRGWQNVTDHLKNLLG